MRGSPAVVSAPFAQREFVVRNLATHVLDIITGAERVYVIYLVASREADLTCVDPIDGVLLIECKFFDDEPAARAWVAHDIALRHAANGRVQ